MKIIIYIFLFIYLIKAEIKLNYCGIDCHCYLNEETKELRINGTGEMNNMSWNCPWYHYRDKIESVIIEENITTIGNYAFWKYNIKSINIPNSVTYSDFENLGNLSVPSESKKLVLGISEISRFFLGF